MRPASSRASRFRDSRRWLIPPSVSGLLGSLCIHCRYIALCSHETLDRMGQSEELPTKRGARNRAPQLPTAHRDVGVTYNAEWWDNNREGVTERFNEWVGS